MTKEKVLELEKLAVHESIKSDKILYWITASKLYEKCSKKYADRIIDASNNGTMWGIYETATGGIRGTFI